MGTIHGLVAHRDGGLRGIQAGQRDWSPFVAHFTSYSAMEPVRGVIRSGCAASRAADILNEADRVSFDIVQSIAKDRCLQVSNRLEEEGVPARVSLSECSLPGLLGHCERFGRFGFVFRKQELFRLGGRPCVYVDRPTYGEIARIGRGLGIETEIGRLFGLANVYSPPGNGQVQDFTHEREWRLFSSLDLERMKPVMLICPSRYVARMRASFPSVESVLACDLLHAWGV